MSLPGPVVDHRVEFERIIPTIPYGALAEFGVYNGGSTRQLAGFGRTVYAFDTFEGMPQVGFDPKLDECNPPGKFKPDLSVEAMFKDYPNIIPMVGLFDATLPQLHPDVCFAFVYLDCDQYYGHQVVLAALRDRMVTGGKFLLDDYSLAGARKAVDEFCAANPGWKLQGNILARI